jgi:hypothetical protein
MLHAIIASSPLSLAIIATALLRANGGQPWMVSAYVVFAALVSAFCVSRVGRRNAAANSQ